MLRDDKDGKIDKDAKSTIEEKIKKVNEVKEGEDKEAIKSAGDELLAELQKIGQAMYNEANTPPAGEEASADEKGRKPAEDVKEESKDEKKEEEEK